MNRISPSGKEIWKNFSENDLILFTSGFFNVLNLNLTHQELLKAYKFLNKSNIFTDKIEKLSRIIEGTQEDFEKAEREKYNKKILDLINLYKNVL